MYSIEIISHASYVYRYAASRALANVNTPEFPRYEYITSTGVWLFRIKKGLSRVTLKPSIFALGSPHTNIV